MGKVYEKVAEIGIRLCAFVAILSLILMVIFLAKEAIPILTSEDISKEAGLDRLILPQGGKFIWEPKSDPPKYSLLPLFINTLKATLIALFVSIPLALGAAIFTSEFAPSWMREVIKPAIEVLAGIPSVVIGFFALIVQATVLQSIFGFEQRLNAVNTGVALGLAVIPIIYTLSEDALSAVPSSYRDAAISLGATKWQTAWRVVLPAAFPGVFAGCVLGFGRAIGETMIVLMSSGAPATVVVRLDLISPVKTFSVAIAQEYPDVAVASPHYHVLFFIGFALLLLTIAINFIGQWFANRLKLKLEGKL